MKKTKKKKIKKSPLVSLGRKKMTRILVKPAIVEDSNIFGLKNMLESLPPSVKDRLMYNTRY